jgi:hypothetical protein
VRGVWGIGSWDTGWVGAGHCTVGGWEHAGRGLVGDCGWVGAGRGLVGDCGWVGAGRGLVGDCVWVGAGLWVCTCVGAGDVALTAPSAASHRFFLIYLIYLLFVALSLSPECQRVCRHWGGIGGQGGGQRARSGARGRAEGTAQYR